MSDLAPPVPYQSHERRHRRWTVRYEFLTTEDCAEALGCSRGTVIRDIAAELLPATVVRRPAGRSFIRVHGDDLLAFVEFDRRRARVAQWLQFHAKQD